MRLSIHHSRPTISNADIQSVFKVLKSSYIATGKLTQDFEDRLAKLLKVNSAVATNSGTSALHLALLALKIKANDEIIIPSFVCTAVLNTILYLGAKPKVVDIDLGDFNLSLKETKKKISPKTKAIILPHIFGKPADIQGFLKLGIPLIENCAHSFGARYQGKPTGTFGTVSTFSFYATKMIATGYGGMVCSNSNGLIRQIRDLIEVDERNTYKVRFNYKMSDIAASLGLTQLKRLNGFISKRKELARFYNRNLKQTNIVLPKDKESNHIYFRYVIRIRSDINRVISSLNKEGIEIKRPVFKPLHHYLGLDKKKFPNTEAAFNSAISIPIYPSLKKSEAEFIVKALHEAIV